LSTRGQRSSPLQNILFWIIERDVESHLGKDVEYQLEWQYEKVYHQSSMKNFFGRIELDYLRKYLSEKQWMKFRNGEREFIIQRRINGKNIPPKV
jgi:hypothetical protein